jgi:hypothetical protein
MRPTLNTGCIRMLIVRQCPVLPNINNQMCSGAFAALRLVLVPLSQQDARLVGRQDVIERSALCRTRPTAWTPSIGSRFTGRIVG